MLKAVSLALLVLLPICTQSMQSSASDYPAAAPHCEPIRVNLCMNLGYNETSMPNFVGHELQSDVEFTLQTFAPLIEYACSTQLKLFLCAAYVPMCTSKIHHVPIGPCRSLCESVRSRCHPVLQGFGYPWPPALECSRFPKENNQETMCMEGEVHSTVLEHEPTGGIISGPKQPTQFQCPGIQSHLYVKLHRTGRCAPFCEADILFGQHEKHLAEVWVATWTYAALGLAVAATLCMICGEDGRNNASKWINSLTPLVWCHVMVTVGWTVRFLAGRTAASCGFDPQVPNVSLLLLDGLSNAFCASTFLLRYYFGMAACVWWAILCLDWHRGVRRKSVEVNHGAHILPAPNAAFGRSKRQQCNARAHNITQSNFARFAAWSLPAFQTAAVIVTRLVDSDELLGVCFVGNQSDKGLQILVLAPLFCYWIFGSVNLISGYLVHRRNKELLQSINSTGQVRVKGAGTATGTGTFLFVYCVPCAVLLLCIIYEFANIDVWLNVPAYVTAIEGITTPLWPFLSRAFMELMMGIICFAWLLGPKISMLYKRKFTAQPIKHPATVAQVTSSQRSTSGSRTSNAAYSMVSYQTVHNMPGTHLPKHHAHTASGMSMNQMSNYSSGRGKCKSATAKLHLYNNQGQRSLHRYGNETIF